MSLMNKKTSSLSFERKFYNRLLSVPLPSPFNGFFAILISSFLILFIVLTIYSISHINGDRVVHAECIDSSTDAMGTICNEFGDIYSVPIKQEFIWNLSGSLFVASILTVILFAIYLVGTLKDKYELRASMTPEERQHLKLYKAKSKDSFQILVDNLQRNACLGHIEAVRRGFHHEDEDYYRFVRIEDHLKTYKEFVRWKYSAIRDGFSYPIIKDI